MGIRAQLDAPAAALDVELGEGFLDTRSDGGDLFVSALIGEGIAGALEGPSSV